MFDVGAVVEFRQHAEQAEAADRSPADEFDEAIGWIGVGRFKSTARERFVTRASREASAPLSVKSRKKELPVPSGRKPSAMRSGLRRFAKTPLRISCAVPSPPTARNLL